MARTDDDTWDPATGVGMTATFGADGAFTGFGGCNNLSGSYAVSGTSGLTISGIAATQMACAADVDRYLACARRGPREDGAAFGTGADNSKGGARGRRRCDDAKTSAHSLGSAPVVSGAHGDFCRVRPSALRGAHPPKPE